MECISIQIEKNDAFFALFYEEFSPGDSLSEIYYVSGFDNPVATKVVGLKDWLVSIWLSPNFQLYAADFEGRIYQINDGLRLMSELDLLGVTLLTGFSEQPEFLLGEGGSFFFNSDGRWQEVNIDGEEALYTATKVDKGRYYLCGEAGLVLKYENQILSRIERPTNVDLHGVCALGSDRFLTVGDLGAAFIYDQADLRDLSIDVESFQDAHSFKGMTLVSAEKDGVFRLNNEDEFVRISDNLSYLFSSNETYCLTHSGTAAHLYDGHVWRSLDIRSLIAQS